MKNQKLEKKQKQKISGKKLNIKKMRKRNNGSLNEGVYDFYDQYSGKNTINKIINYYLDKISKYGKDSLSSKEKQIFDEANQGKMTLDKPIYKKNKLTGDIELDNQGKAIRIDLSQTIPGVPFITSKGKGMKKKEVINARCYWDVGSDCKYYFVFNNGVVSAENPSGLIWFKTVSEGKDFGSFMKLKSTYVGATPDELWKKIDNDYDKGCILDYDALNNFLTFYNLYKTSKRENIARITELYEFLRDYTGKK